MRCGNRLLTTANIGGKEFYELIPTINVEHNTWKLLGNNDVCDGCCLSSGSVGVTWRERLLKISIKHPSFSPNAMLLVLFNKYRAKLIDREKQTYRTDGTDNTGTTKRRTQV